MYISTKAKCSVHEIVWLGGFKDLIGMEYT